MSDKLKIYACSGIGNHDEMSRKPIGFYTDGTNTLENTQAVNTLLAKLNVCRIEAERLKTLTSAERLDALNEMDVYSVGLAAARQYAKDIVKLGTAGYAIAAMISAGDFNYNGAERQDHLDHLIEKMQELVNSGDYSKYDKEFVSWWESKIVARNKVGTDFAQRMAMHKAIKAQKAQKAQKVGEVDEAWKDDEELSKYLCDGGTYFLYLFFTDKQLAKLPSGNRALIKARAKGQKQTYNYCKATFVGIYGSEEEMVEIIRAGIVDRFEDTPEQVCQDIADGKRNIESVGIATEVIVAIIGMIATVLVALISAICEAIKQRNSDKYAALNQQVIEQSCPNEEDFEGLNVKGATTTAGMSSGTLLGVGAVAIALLLFRNN